MLFRAWGPCEDIFSDFARRKRSGDLVVRPDKPAAIAATMPHPRALGKKAVDQFAESELGRLALRGELEPVLATAGGGLCAALAGVHREPLCSQSPCSAPAATAAERWARCGLLRTPLVSIAAFFARVDL